MFGLSHRAPTSDPADPRYLKGYFDLLFVAYYIVFFSFVRQIVTVTLLGRAAKYFGIKRESKVDRFGEQGYFIVYFLIFGAWGFVSPSAGRAPAHCPNMTDMIAFPSAAHNVPASDVVVSDGTLLDRFVLH
jgi:hypothetical protein